MNIWKADSEEMYKMAGDLTSIESAIRQVNSSLKKIRKHTSGQIDEKTAEIFAAKGLEIGDKGASLSEKVKQRKEDITNAGFKVDELERLSEDRVGNLSTKGIF